MVTHNFDDAFGHPATGKPEGGRKLQFVPVRIENPTELSDVRKQLDAILMPHRQLLLASFPISLSRGGIPSPNLVRIEPVQFLFQPTTREVFQITLEVPINVIRMVFVFDKRAIHEDLTDPDLPQLADQDRKVANESSPPIDIPEWKSRSPIRPKNQG